MGNSDKYYQPGLNELATEISVWAQRAGFHDEPRPFDGMLANVHSEVSEALEEWRSGRGMTENYWNIKATPEDDIHRILRFKDGQMWVRNYDYDYRGSDPTIEEWLVVDVERLRRMPGMVRYLSPEGIPTELADIIIRTLHIAAFFGIDIAAALADKMAYNETRPRRNGGKKS